MGTIPPHPATQRGEDYFGRQMGSLVLHVEDGIDLDHLHAAPVCAQVDRYAEDVDFH